MWCLKMKYKFLIGLFLTVSLISLAQASLSTDANNYRVTSQTGFEEVYDIKMQR